MNYKEKRPWPNRQGAGARKSSKKRINAEDELDLALCKLTSGEGGTSAKRKKGGIS